MGFNTLQAIQSGLCFTVALTAMACGSGGSSDPPSPTVNAGKAPTSVATTKSPASTSTVAVTRPTAKPTTAVEPGKVERVRFKPGKTGAEVKDSVVRGERNRYQIGASKGQTMTVSITSLEDNAAFKILAPGGEVIPGTEEEKDLRKWTGILPASGDTVVSVGPTRGNATYTLTIDVSAKSEAQCTGDAANSELPCTLKDGRWGWCKAGACKDICPAGYSYHPDDTRCHQRRDCKSGMDMGTKTAQCSNCNGEHCFDPTASKDLR